MKINFDIEDYKVTYGEWRDFLRKQSSLETINVGPFTNVAQSASFFADAVQKQIEELNKETYGIPMPEDWPTPEKEEAHRVSVYITAKHALGNVYKYPETEDESNIQNVLSFILSGALSLIREDLEHYGGRTLADFETLHLCAFLDRFSWQAYEKQHPEQLVDKEGEEEGDGE